MASYTITTKSSYAHLTHIIKKRVRRDAAELMFERAVYDAICRRSQLDTLSGKKAYELAKNVHTLNTDRLKITIKDLSVEFLKTA